ncbi:hypothetical protein L1887_55804 [Cichorium endivia]|nr:hypothetical protein L1887_55804 [Cichorium endivia]
MVKTSLKMPATLSVTTLVRLMSANSARFMPNARMPGCADEADGLERVCGRIEIARLRGKDGVPALKDGRERDECDAHHGRKPKDGGDGIVHRPSRRGPAASASRPHLRPPERRRRKHLHRTDQDDLVSAATIMTTPRVMRAMMPIRLHLITSSPNRKGEEEHKGQVGALAHGVEHLERGAAEHKLHGHVKAGDKERVGEVLLVLGEHPLVVHRDERRKRVPAQDEQHIDHRCLPVGISAFLERAPLPTLERARRGDGRCLLCQPPVRAWIERVAESARRPSFELRAELAVGKRRMSDSDDSQGSSVAMDRASSCCALIAQSPLLNVGRVAGHYLDMLVKRAKRDDRDK